MSFRDRLRPAVFRGVPFGVDSAEHEYGQRLVPHEFPQRQEPLVDWMGRKVRQYKITGFLLGDNYREDLARLTKKFESPPLGFPFFVGTTLRHPYLGELRVIGQALRVKESRAEGGMARLEMTFLEAGREHRPPDTSGQVAGKAAALEEAAGVAATTAALEELEVTGQPQTSLDAIADELTKAAQTLKGLEVFSGPAKEVAAFFQKVEAVINTAAALATAPADMANAMLGVLDDLAAAAGNATGALAAYSSLLGLEPAATPGASQAALTASSNATATQAFIQTAAAGGAVTAAVAVPWASTTDALEAQAALTAKLDALLLEAGDTTYPALADLRALAVEGIPSPGQNLPDIVTVTMPGSMPALVMAARLYGDARREREIVERNRVRHPLFMPGGIELEVLNG